MSRKKFGQLLQKYLRGECTPAEKAFVEHWYGLLETETGQAQEALDTDELENRLWNQIQQRMPADAKDEPGRVIPFGTARFRWIGIAASLLLMGGWVLGAASAGYRYPDRFTYSNRPDRLDRADQCFGNSSGCPSGRWKPCEAGGP